jgi:AGZA family xanthine/uracil permease-like MFS transporter
VKTAQHPGGWQDEINGGLVNFLAVMYIIAVNPLILSTKGTGMPFDGVMTATVLLAFSMTLLMGLYAKLPYVVAPGMGVNAYFTYTLVLRQEIPWQVALGMVFWAGVIFLAISVTKLREHIAKAIPQSLRIAAAVGIGLFLTLIGLKSCGLVVGDKVTFVRFGGFTQESVLALTGIVIIAGLMIRNFRGAMLGGIVTITVLGSLVGVTKTPTELVSAPNFSTFFAMDIWGALSWAFVPAILGIMFTDLFDSISTFVGVSKATGLVDEEGHPKNLKEGLLVDSFATLGAGVFGSSSGTAFIESAAGIESGGRTGRAAVITAFCFLPFLFFAPLVAIVPACATGPVLIIVGATMFKSAKEISAEALEDLIPAFITIVLIPFTFSITTGIMFGFIAHTLMYLLVGRWKDVSPIMYVLAAASIVLLTIEHLHS